MASLKDARALAEQLHGVSGRLQSELEKNSVDFERLVELSDEIGESADRLAATFNAINGSLTGLLEGRDGDQDERGAGEGGEEKKGKGEKAGGGSRGGGGGRGRGGRQKRQKQSES